MLLWYQYHTISDQVWANTWKRMKGKSLTWSGMFTHTHTHTHIQSLTHTHTRIKKHKHTQTWKDVSDNGIQAVAQHNLVLQVIFRLVEVIVVLNNGLRDLNTRTANQELHSYWWWRRLSVCNTKRSIRTQRVLDKTPALAQQQQQKAKISSDYRWT